MVPLAGMMGGVITFYNSANGLCCEKYGTWNYDDPITFHVSNICMVYDVAGVTTMYTEQSILH